jgi:hypothetical protein
MVSLHDQLDNFYKGLQQASGEVAGDIGTFTSVFAPQLDQLKTDKIMLDLLQLGFAIISAFSFNSCKAILMKY